MGRCGTSTDHCCWINGQQCPYVVNSPNAGFNWACSLRLREGDWAKVYETPEYRAFVRPALTAAGIAKDCGDWPPPGHKCNECGEVG